MQALKIFVVWFFFFIALSSFVFASTHYESNGNVFHFWNAERDYFIDIETGLQMPNNVNETWSKNFFCAGFNYLGWKYYCTDSLDFDWSLESDNQTFVNVTGYKDITKIINGNVFELRVGVRYGLENQQKFLRITPFIKNIGSIDIPVELGFGWNLKDIKIGNTYSDDEIFVNGNYYDMNQSGIINLTSMQNTNVFMRDKETGEWMGFNWSGNLDYRFIAKSKTGEPNGVVNLFVKTIGLGVGERKGINLFWGDRDKWFNNTQTTDGDKVCGGSVPCESVFEINITNLFPEMAEGVCLKRFNLDYEGFVENIEEQNDVKLHNFSFYNWNGTGWNRFYLNDVCFLPKHYKIKVVAYKDGKSSMKWSIPKLGIDPWWNGTDFGWDYVNDTNYVRLWNEHNTYYLNTSSGVHLANFYGQPWSKDEICVDYWNESKCQRNTNFDRTIQEVFNQTINVTFNHGDIKITYQLNRNDANLTVYVESGGNIIRWKTWDVNVPPNNFTDFVWLDDVYYMNESFNVTVYNLSKDWVYYWDSSSGKNVWTSINTSQYYAVQADNESNTISINSNSTKFNWLDALCNWATTMTSPTSTVNLTEGETFNMDGYISYFGTCYTRGSIEARVYYDGSWKKIDGTTNLSTGDSNAQSCLGSGGTCSASGWTVTGENAGEYTVSLYGVFNREAGKYSGTEDVNVSEALFRSCSYTNIASDTTLSDDSSSCYNFTESNIVFDCAGYTVTGNQAQFDPVFRVYEKENVTIKNCVVTNSSIVFGYNWSGGGKVYNNTLINNGITTGFDNSLSKGFCFLNSSDFFVENNTVTNFTVNNTLTGNCFDSSLNIVYVGKGTRNGYLNNLSLEGIIYNQYTGDGSAIEGCQDTLLQDIKVFEIENAHNLTFDNVLANFSMTKSENIFATRKFVSVGFSYNPSNITFNHTRIYTPNLSLFAYGGEYSFDNVRVVGGGAWDFWDSAKSGVFIANSHFESMKSDQIINIEGLNDVVIKNCTFLNTNHANTLIAMEGTNNLFVNNYLNNLSTSGTYVGVVSSYGSGNFSFNEFHNITGRGIIFYAGSDNYADSNFIDASGADYYSVVSTNNKVVNGSTDIIHLGSNPVKVGWYARFNVTDQDGSPVNNAEVNITENGWDSTNPNISTTTGVGGLTGWKVLWQGYSDTDYQVENTTTPHTVNISNDEGVHNYTTIIVNETKTWDFGLVISLDSCECPGVGVDWSVDFEDYCYINENCDISVGVLNLSGSGNFTCSAVINVTSINLLGDGVLWVQPDCVLNVG